MINIRSLECSSKGDKRFSAFYALVDFAGRTTSIELFYQNSKRFHDFSCESKGKAPDYCVIGGYKLPMEYAKTFYEYLWVKYLYNHPELVEYIQGFDLFTDMFKSKNSVVCQADSITNFKQFGIEYIRCMTGIVDIIAIDKRIYKGEEVCNLTEIKGDLFKDLNGVFVQCCSADFVLGKGIALQFNKHFDTKNILEERYMSGEVGNCYKADNVFCLVTKQVYNGKPSYRTLYRSLRDLNSQLNYLGITKIKMPQIGSGLDRLNWEVVKRCIKDALENIEVEVYFE